MLNYSKYLEELYKIQDFFIKNFSNDENIKKHVYYDRIKNMLLNKVNNYIDFINFYKIEKFFDKKTSLLNSKINILDLGCGAGDKSIILKSIFSKANIKGLETVNYDDKDHIKTKPYEFFNVIYKNINSFFKVDLGLYDGKNFDLLDDNGFDIVMIYAVIEHIKPESRQEFIKEITPKLKKGGYLIITRCPRYYGLMEFLSRKFSLGAHEWVLKKNELLNLFENNYEVKDLTIMNNIPNNYNFTKGYPQLFILLDKILSFIYWPFATDYFLILKEKDV